MVYSIFLYVTYCIYRSTWFFVLSVYYALLCVARILVFKQTPSKSKLRSKILTMRTCGCFLLAINIIFSIMSFILINETPQSKYHEIIVISLATYTFFLLGDAIIGSVKTIKINNHVFLSAKLISLTSASVSLLTLTNTMLVTWGKENVTFICGSFAFDVRFHGLHNVEFSVAIVFRKLSCCRWCFADGVERCCAYNQSQILYKRL